MVVDVLRCVVLCCVVLCCVMRMIDERFDAERGVRSERWDDGMR